MKTQVTLNSSFDNQGGHLKMELDFTTDEKRKKCRCCGRYKSLNEFDDNTKSKDGKLMNCRICNIKLKSDAKYYWRKHRKRQLEKAKIRNKIPAHILKRREEWFLYSHGRSAGFFQGGGFCILCDYDDPLGLENHHVVPHVDNVDDFILSLCGGCHKKYQKADQEQHMKAVQNAIEKSIKLWRVE